MNTKSDGAEVRAVEVTDAEIAEVLQQDAIMRRPDVGWTEGQAAWKRLGEIGRETAPRMARELQALRADVALLQDGHVQLLKQAREHLEHERHARIEAERRENEARTDLGQERQARIAADERVTALSRELLKREAERDDLRARLAAITAPVDVGAEVTRRAREVLDAADGVCTTPSALDSTTERVEAALRPLVEREAQIRRALAAAEDDGQVGRSEDDLQYSGSGDPEPPACSCGDHIAGKCPDEHREAFGVQPPRVPSEDDAEERGVPADDVAAVAALAGVDPPQQSSAGGSFYVATTDHGARVVRHGWVMATCEAKDRSANIADAHTIAMALNRPAIEEWESATKREAADRLAAEQKLARVVSLAQALFVAQRGDRSIAAYEASEALRKYVEAIAGDVRPMLTEERAREMAAEILRAETQNGLVVVLGSTICATVARALLRVSRGDYGPAREPSRMAQAACAAFIESDAAYDSAPKMPEPLTRDQAEVWAEHLDDRCMALSSTAKGVLVEALMAAARGETEPR